MVINKNYLINGRAEKAGKAARGETSGSASRTGRDVGRVGGLRRLGGLGQVGRVGQVGQVGRVGQVGQVRRVGQVERVGVRAKASECMELGMWGRLWDRWGG